MSVVILFRNSIDAVLTLYDSKNTICKRYSMYICSIQLGLKIGLPVPAVEIVWIESRKPINIYDFAHMIAACFHLIRKPRYNLPDMFPVA